MTRVADLRRASLEQIEAVYGLTIQFTAELAIGAVSRFGACYSTYLEEIGSPVRRWVQPKVPEAHWGHGRFNTERGDDMWNTPAPLAFRKAVRDCYLVGECYKDLKNILATEDELMSYNQRKQDPNDAWENVFAGSPPLPAEPAHHDHRKGVDGQNGDGDRTTQEQEPSGQGDDDIAHQI